MIRTNENDMIGKRFGMLTVVSKAPDKIVSGVRKTAWKCKCDCGNFCDVEQGNLITGNSKSCGCQKSKKPRKDITGQKFGHLTVIERAPDHVRANGRHVTMWRCKCDCGNEKIVTTDNLVYGNTTSCGCYKRDRQKTDLTGQKFGHLTVLKKGEDYVTPSGEHRTTWVCQCDCPEHNIITVPQSSLKSGNTTSCGCLNRKHGMSKSRIYTIYYDMVARCYKPDSINYSNYGGRGITICDEWRGENGFINFYNWAINNGYNETLSIDRYDNDGQYNPSNCRWADKFVQSNNRRSNQYITVNGDTHTYAEWEYIRGYPESTISNRIHNGMNPQDAVNGTSNCVLPINAIYFVDDDGNVDHTKKS